MRPSAFHVLCPCLTCSQGGASVTRRRRSRESLCVRSHQRHCARVLQRRQGQRRRFLAVIQRRERVHPRRSLACRSSCGGGPTQPCWPPPSLCIANEPRSARTGRRVEVHLQKTRPGTMVTAGMPNWTFIRKGQPAGNAHARTRICKYKVLQQLVWLCFCVCVSCSGPSDPSALPWWSARCSGCPAPPPAASRGRPTCCPAAGARPRAGAG